MYTHVAGRLVHIASRGYNIRIRKSTGPVNIRYIQRALSRMATALVYRSPFVASNKKLEGRKVLKYIHIRRETHLGRSYLVLVGL